MISDTFPAAVDGRRLDRIQIVGVRGLGHHGLLETERHTGQDFVVDVVMHLDTRPAAAGDDLAGTVDYAEVAADVHALITGEPVDLIETLAERIAAAVLRHPAVAAVDVAVHKPHAPIPVPFEDVVVSIRRERSDLELAVAAGGTAAIADLRAVDPGQAGDGPARANHRAEHRAAEATPEPEPVPTDALDVAPGVPVPAVLAVGSNLGSSSAVLRQAVADLAATPGIDVVGVSPLARTAPVGGPAQEDYLNAVLAITTTLAPRALLHACQRIETAHGRVREQRWGPRTLDIDLIVYQGVVAAADDLELPHPRAHQRAFVLEPWAHLDPDAVLPGLGGGPVAALAATAPDRDGVRWLAVDWLADHGSPGQGQEDG